MPINKTCVTTHLVQVALPVPIADYFDYLATDELPAIGARVSVPFGRRHLVGLVVSYIPKTASSVPKDKLRPITSIIDKTPILPQTTLDFAHFLSTYYRYPLGETLAVMLPAAIRQGKPLISGYFDTPYWQVDTALSDKIKVLSYRATKQHTLLTKLLPHCGKKVSLSALKQLGFGTKERQIWQDKGVLIPTCPPPEHIRLNASPLSLTDEQKAAVLAITHACKQGYQGFLLYGVTGSGKTEVYLQAMYEVLKTGKQVLILVPEIGLTPQTKARFDERFCANILVLHSKMSDNERLAGFVACQDGSADIVIATRSACFYPFANLGLIIIDECHDSSYKQDDHLRYHTCDVSMYLAYTLGVPIVLGSATPSLEQLHLCNIGKLTKISLSKRKTGTAPCYHLVDKRLGTHHHTSKTGDNQTSGLAPRVVHAIREKLDRGEQVLIFLNKRGYAPILLCQSCGYQADCVRCSSHMTYHKKYKNRLICHHCGYECNPPTVCPDCNSPNLITLGQGTSQLYEHLHALFANPQSNDTPYPILQINKDTMGKKNDWQSLYQTLNNARPMILVGTQMLTKGHHFPNVTLVVIVDADSGFLSPNFRAPELISQQIVQVAGRAGREHKAGDVIIQTLKPDNAILQTLITKGYLAVAERLLAERKQLSLPPYAHAALIQSKSTDYHRAKEAIIAIKHILPNPNPLAVLAPIDAPLLKKNNLYHVQMLLLAHTRLQMRQTLDAFWNTAKNLPSSKSTHLSIEIDPLGW